MRTWNSPASAEPSVMLGRPSSLPQSPQRPPQPLFDFFLMCDPALPPSSSAVNLAFLHRGQSSLPATIPGSLLLRWPSGLSLSSSNSAVKSFPPTRISSPSSHCHCPLPAGTVVLLPFTDGLPGAVLTLPRRGTLHHSLPSPSLSRPFVVWSPRTFLSQNPMCIFQFFFSLTSQAFGSSALFPFQNILFLFFFFL